MLGLAGEGLNMNKWIVWFDLAMGIILLSGAVATAVRGSFLWTVALLIAAVFFFRRFAQGRINK